jgi:hypothetical protein
MVKLEYRLQIKTVLTTGDVIRMTLPLVIKSPEEYACQVAKPQLLSYRGGGGGSPSHFAPRSFRVIFGALVMVFV